MEKLLFFAAGNEKKAEQLAELSEKLQIGFVPVSPMETGQQIGYLAGAGGFGKKKISLPELPPKMEEEVLVFYGFSEERLDMVLGMLRGSGLTISLKAVVTAHNIGWSLAALGSELAVERAQIQKQQARQEI